MITLAVTGHRPERLGNTAQLEAHFRQFLIDNEVFRVYQGMCEGFDLLSAGVSKDIGIPYVACRPWRTHISGLPEHYSQVIKDAQEVHHTSTSMVYAGPILYHNRNRYMVDKADAVYAAWDGNTFGGTFQTVEYAMAQGKRVYRFDVDNPGESKWLG